MRAPFFLPPRAVSYIRLSRGALKARTRRPLTSYTPEARGREGKRPLTAAAAPTAGTLLMSEKLRGKSVMRLYPARPSDINQAASSARVERYVRGASKLSSPSASLCLWWSRLFCPGYSAASARRFARTGNCIYDMARERCLLCWWEVGDCFVAGRQEERGCARVKLTCCIK